MDDYNDILRFLPDATPEQIASAKRGDAAGRRITREVWGDRCPPGHDYYVLDDNNIACPVGLGTWSVWSEHQWNITAQGGVNRRSVGNTKIGPYEVQTVFLGLDHSFGMGGPRALFETVILDHRTTARGMTGRLCAKPTDYQERYATYPQAIAGHAEAVEWAKIERVLDTTDDFERARKVASPRRPRQA